jgi:hypothetical protein
MAQHISDDGLSPVTYSLSNILPNGLSFNVSTGVLTYDGLGVASVSSHQLTATDAVGSAQSSAFNINIEAASANPPPAELTIRASTLHSIEIDWLVTSGVDDTTPNATVAVQYKKAADSVWLDALDLIRTLDFAYVYNADSGPNQNRFSGSIFFLTPGTTYNVRCTWTDPDATDAEHGNTYQTTVTTRSIPTKPVGDEVTVTNDATLLAAISGASAGRVIKMQTGVYSGFTFNKSGTENNYIVLEADTGHTPIVEGTITIAGDYLWLDGLSYRWDGTGDLLTLGDADTTSAIYFPSGPARTGLVVTNSDCTLANTSLPTPYSGSGKGALMTGQHYANFVYGFITVTNQCIIMNNDILGPWSAGIGTTGIPSPSTSTTKGISLGGEGRTTP